MKKPPKKEQKIIDAIMRQVPGSFRRQFEMDALIYGQFPVRVEWVGDKIEIEYVTPHSCLGESRKELVRF